MKIALFLIALAVAASLDVAAYGEARLTSAQKAAIRAGVAKELKDPPSARFGVMRAANIGGTLFVCGVVNAKTSAGGYAGNGPYFGRFHAGRFIVEASGAYLVGLECQNRGISVLDDY